MNFTPTWKTKYHHLTFFFLFAAILSVGHAAFCGGANSRISPYEEKLLEYINQYRVKNGLHPLSPDDTLRQLALGHCRQMDKTDSLNHDAFRERFDKCGRSHCVENVGWNSPTPGDQFRAWKTSPGHNANLLNGKIKFAGISKVGAYVTFFACD